MSRARGAPEGYRRGVGLMMFNPAGRIFTGRRIDTEIEAWQMPQGGIDDGESPRDAAMRELREETGVENAVIVAESAEWKSYDFPSDLRARVWGGLYRGQTQKWFLLRFTGSDSDIDIESADPNPEFDDWQWMDIESLPRRIVAFKRRLYEDLAAEFGDLIAREAGRR